MELKAAMHAIRTDPSKHQQFVKDPAATLKGMGVNVDHARIVKTQQTPVGSTHTACASTGCGACVSVG